MQFFEFKAGDGLIGSGVKGTVHRIPAGWQQLFVLSAGQGILDGASAVLKQKQCFFNFCCHYLSEQ